MGTWKIFSCSIVCWLALLSFGLLASEVDAVLVGTILLPHGDFAYDPFLFPAKSRERRISQDVALAARQAGQWLVETAKPDIILLSTPHGIKLDRNYGIYASPRGHGHVTIGGDLHNNSTKSYNVSLDIDLAPTVAQELLHDWFPGNNVSGIYAYDDSSAMPLNWGEILPLLLLPSHHFNHLIWSHPHWRYDHAPEMVPELLSLGARLAEWAQKDTNKLRVAVIISGDLSHTHQADGPYGYSNSSYLFDKAIGHWAASPCHNANSLLQVSKRLQPDAKSCGFTGYVLWHGMMCSPSSIIGMKYHSQVLVNRNVTYYGMISAIFEPIGTPLKTAAASAKEHLSAENLPETAT